MAPSQQDYRDLRDSVGGGSRYRGTGEGCGKGSKCTTEKMAVDDLNR